MTYLIPGDAAVYMAGPSATQEDIERLRGQLGLADPIWVQYFRLLGNVARGDFGRSLYTRQPVFEVVLRSFPYSWLLGVTALVLSILIGIPAGVISAVARGSLLDRAITLLVLLGYSVPGFWLALMLILVFSLYLGLLPAIGVGKIEHIILPSIALSSTTAAIVARMTRSSLLEVLSEDYVRTARSKGLAEPLVLTRHALRNSLIPVTTVCGLEFSRLIGRSVVIESVFAWPGIGTLLLNAILARDLPLVEGIVFIYALTVVAINFVVDLSYYWLDPRIQYA